MIEFLKLLLLKLPAGYTMSFKKKEGFFESSQDKGIVIEITILNHLNMMGQIQITEEFIEQTVPDILDQLVDEKIQKIFNQLKIS